MELMIMDAADKDGRKEGSEDGEREREREGKVGAL